LSFGFAGRCWILAAATFGNILERSKTLSRYETIFTKMNCSSLEATEMLRRIAIIAGFLLADVVAADAMTFSWRDNSTVYASGPIEEGDGARFEALHRFKTLELNSPGGLVGEALRIAKNMDVRGDIRTVVKPGQSCASACAMALFVSGETRVVYWGGRLGIHSCASSDGAQAPECNEAMAANANKHGVPWGVIEGFGNYTKPTTMMWIGAEESECFGLMRWSAQDTESNGIACYQFSMWKSVNRAPPEVTAENANHILCRMNARTSLIYISTGDEQQGFSATYRKSCEHIAADPKTPKYSAVDIIMWLALSDPDVMALRPGTLMIRIMNDDGMNIGYCWKCLTIMGMSRLMHGYPKEALEDFRKAINLVKRDRGSVPGWLTSRVDVAAEAAKVNP
jgi:hypothetical protein